MSEVRDRWADGHTYENFMGRWSRQLAPQFVSWLRAPRGIHWLDVGCGTGALTSAICRHFDPASVVGCDPSPPFIEFARTHCEDVRASFVLAGAGGFPGRVDGYGSVTSLLALNFFPDADAAIREMKALAAPHGVVSACVWDYGDKMELLRFFWDAVVALDADTRAFDEGGRFPICRPDALTDLFSASGLSSVRCESIEIATEFSSFDDYWRPLLGGTGTAPAHVASLDAGHRDALAEKLKETLPRGPGGSFALTARAWAVRGTAD